MPHFSLSTLGDDRPGVVAAVSGVLARHGVNIEDSRMATLRGRFAMMLVVSAGKDLDRKELTEELESTGSQLGLESISLIELPELDIPTVPAPTHMVTVYGGDHPGIVSSIASTLAQWSVNISDLSTKLVGEADNPLYVMFLEVELPDEVDPDRLREELEQTASRQNVEVTLRALDSDAL